MRRMLLTIIGLVMFVAPVLAQQQVSVKPDCVIPFSFTAAGQTTPVANGVGDFRYIACTTWHLRYYSQGFSGVSIEFRSAPDAGGAPGVWATWGTGTESLASGTTLPLTSTVAGQATGYRYRPWVQVKLNSATGSGLVEGVLEGWKPASGADSSGPAAAGSTTNLTQVGGAGIALGQAAMAASLPVAIASNQSAVPVSGTVTATQPTGTNLHAVLDTTSTTAVTQATGTNLHAVLDTTSTTAVSHPSGKNLHAVFDSGSTTAATQATASNLNATVVGTGTFVVQATLAAETTKVIGTSRIVGNLGAVFDFAGQNAASPANAVLIGCQFNTSPTTITTANSSPEQCDSAGNQLVNLKTAIPAGANIIGAVTQSGNWTARIVGNAGGIVDFAGQNAASPANALLTGCQFNSSPTTVTTTNSSPCQMNSKGQLLVTTVASSGSINCVVPVSTATTITAVGGSCAAPGAGLSVYITDIEFGSSAAGGTAADSFPTLKSGTGTTCGTGTAVIWQAMITANGNVIADLTQPIKVAANSDVCWIMSTAGSKTIQIHGFIAP